MIRALTHTAPAVEPNLKQKKASRLHGMPVKESGGRLLGVQDRVFGGFRHTELYDALGRN